MGLGTKKEARVQAKDIMTSDVICCAEDASVNEAAKTLNQHRITGAPVLDRSGRLAGIVTEADVLFRQGNTVADIMTRDVYTVEEDTSVEDTAILMAAYRIKRVPVLRGGKVVGIVSRADIVRAMATGEVLPLQSPVFDL